MGVTACETGCDGAQGEGGHNSLESVEEEPACPQDVWAE